MQEGFTNTIASRSGIQDCARPDAPAITIVMARGLAPSKREVVMGTGQNRRSWDEEVLDRLSAHAEAERSTLAEYAAAAEMVEAPDVRYLMQLILDDERRHHRIFDDMARAVRAAHEWRHQDSEVPSLTGGPLPESLKALTRRLLDVEQEDERELKALRRQLRPVADTTLWALLVDLVSLDTKKHERILEFIMDHADD